MHPTTDHANPNLKQAVSYWLMPDSPTAAALEQLSHSARQHLNACWLPPHITLYSDLLDSTNQAIERLITTAHQQHPLWLQPATIEAGGAFTQSLLLRFQLEKGEAVAQAALQAWCQDLRQRSTDALGYRLDPHLSLVYSNDALPIRQARASALTPPTTSLRFDRVSAVSHPLRIQTARDIAAFTTLTIQSLH